MATEAQKFARFAKVAMVTSNSEMFATLDKAGQGKAEFMKPLVSLLGRNDPYVSAPGMIGDGPSRPIVLSTSLSDMRQKMRNRLKANAPIVVFVDLLAILQNQPPRRAEGQYDLSVTEQARDIITMVAGKYGYCDVSLIVGCMDVHSKTTRLRNIAHANRNKVQSTQTLFYALDRIKSPRDHLSSIGSFSSLMRSEKDSFVRYLAEEIVNQMKGEDCPDEEWYPSKLFGKAAFGFIGGSPNACAFIGPLNVKLGSTCYVDRRTVEQRMATVVDQGEGECMIFSAMHRLLTNGFENSRGPLDCLMDIHCEDTDAMAGMAMYFAYSLEDTSRNGGKHFKGSIMIQGHGKSASQVLKMSKYLRESLGFLPTIQPTGKGYYFQWDVLALYYRLEANDDLATLPAGHRAVSTTAAGYGFLNNDYIATEKGGSNYADFMNVLKSKELQKAIDSFPGGAGRLECSPLILDPISFSALADNKDNKSGYNLSGMLLCHGVMMINKKETRRLLSRKYSPSEMLAFFPDKIPYDVIRAAAYLAGERVPVPDPIATLSHLSCSDYVLHLWLRRPYQSSIEPAVGEDELVQTSYVIPKKMTKGNTKCSVEYSLLSVAKRLARVGDNSEMTREILESTRFGRIFSSYQFRGDSKWLFPPLDEVAKTVASKGLYPSPQVPADLVLPTFQADSTQELVGFVAQFSSYLSNEQDKEHGANCLGSVFELTLCSRTAYNPDGAKLGRPLLVSNTPESISTGGFTGNGRDGHRGWAKKTQWSSPAVEELSKLTVKELFSKLRTAESSVVIKLFEELCLYVFSKSSGIPLSNLESRVALARLSATVLDD